MKNQGITRFTLCALALAAVSITLTSCTQPMGSSYSQYGNSYPDPYNPSYGSTGGQQQPQAPYANQGRYAQQQQPASQGGYYAQQPPYPQSQGGYSGGGDGARVEPVYEQPSYNPPAPSSTPARTSSASASASRTHTVKSGETLWRLSQRYGTSVSAIKKANGIPSSSNIIVTGSRIKIP